MNIRFLLYLLFLHSVLSLEKFLRFSQNKDITDRKLVYELDQKPIIIDALLDGQVLVKFRQYIPDFIPPNFIFHCQVKMLDDSNKILNSFLCKKDTLSSKEDCHPVNKENKIVKFGEDMTFDITYDPITGFTATLVLDIVKVKNRIKPFDGFYYCKLSNLVGALTSNYIEIQDYEFYKKKISRFVTPIVTKYEPTSISDIKTDAFPTYLDCGKSVGDFDQDLPKWAKDNIVSPFVWNFCPSVTDGLSCYTMLVDSRFRESKSLGEYLEYYQYPNGTIVILGMKNADYKKSGLVCSYISLPLKAYAIYLTKDGSKWKPITFVPSSQYTRRIQILSPTNTEILVREGTYGNSRFKLRATYVANPDHAKRSYIWQKDGYHIMPNFETNPHELIFPVEITKEHRGKYTLKVSQTEIKDSVEFVFNVKVAGVPTLIKGPQFSDTIFKMVDQTVNLSVEFDDSVTKRSLEINGIKIDFSSDEMKAASLKSLFSLYQFLTGISVTFDLGDATKPGLMVYHASNLFWKKDAPQPKTHTVTFVAENEIGISKASFFIQVFGNPVFTNYPNDDNCTNNCRSSEKHVFRCTFDSSEFVTGGLQVNYLWNLNEYNLNNMNDDYIQKAYLKIKNDTVELGPIASDNSDKDEKMTQILKDATLSCQVTIHEPLRLGHNPPSSLRLYNSDDNADLKQLLKARIILDVTAIYKGSPSWILPLIISLIVLVVIVVMVLYFCLRGSGETYNVDQKERAQGYDPEKEIRDNEVFQPYERDHDNNVMQPSRLSFNDDDSVGVGSDDGELDVYDIDPGKFNEEGSFIGQYASDPRKTKVASA